jgi:hypothetical protein
MFEAQTKETSGGSGLLIAACVIVVLAVVGTLAYLNKGPAKSSEASAAGASSMPTGLKGDPVKDLHIASATMDKDYTGTTAVWSVQIKNQSSVYTYSNIGYQTSYFGSDNSILVQNKGKITLSLAPGEGQTTQFRDVLYPDSTAWYRFTVVGADTSK